MTVSEPSEVQGEVGRKAVISDCGIYRYRLERDLSGAPKVAAFIMVNPSTADAETDDQTIRKCIGFSRANGFGRFLVGNKFAFRATDISALRDARDPIGPDNDRHLEEIMREADVHIAAWGSLSKLPETLRKRWHDIVRMSDRLGVTLHCIGTNDDKHPKHPQMTGYAVPVTKWSVPWFAGRASFPPPGRTNEHEREAMMDVQVQKIDPQAAERDLDRFGAFSARSVIVDGSEIVVLIYSNGPTPHHNVVERAIGAIPELRRIVGGQP